LDFASVRLLHEEDVRGHAVVGGGGHLRLDDAVLVPLKEVADVEQQTGAIRGFNCGNDG
jgi:hypothetical protein